MRVVLSESAGYLKLITAGDSNNNNRLYLGNMRVTVNDDGTIRLVNVVPTAHYLYGIVPYEMSEGCSIEGLKSQAVSCKTYAFGYTNPGVDYDITDSYTYQGYRGYKAGYPVCMSACLGVIGSLLFYNGGVPLAFYGATNGGETALPSHVFGHSLLDDQYEIKQDDVDLEYGSMRVKTLDIVYDEAVTNAAFYKLLKTETEKQLGREVDRLAVAKAEVNTPKYPGCTRNMANIDLTVRLLGEETETAVGLSFSVEKLKSSGVFSGSYRIYWGEETDRGYAVHFCRFGHGVGLSQMGADGFAQQGWSYRRIVGFYFGKMDLLTVKEDNPERPYAYTNTIVAYGVTNTGGVRMRSEPSPDGRLFGTFAKNAHINIVSEKDGWLLCVANGKLGYIRGDLVDVVLYPSPSGALISLGDAVISNKIEAAELFDGPSDYRESVGTAAPGTQVEVWAQIGSWSRIKLGDEYYFVRTSELDLRSWSPIDLHDRVSFRRERKIDW